MTQEPLQGQDAFLDAARAQATRVAMFLANGIRLVGCVELFDQHTVLLSSATGRSLCTNIRYRRCSRTRKELDQPDPSRSKAGSQSF